MNREEISERLCVHDKRNPMYEDFFLFAEDPEPVINECSCDACFYGSAKIADFALKLMDAAQLMDKRALSGYEPPVLSSFALQHLENDKKRLRYVMNKNYILKDKEVVEVGIDEWSEWLHRDFALTRLIAKTSLGLSTPNPGIEVSTVFLQCDHNFGSGPPILFETMVFNGDKEDEMERYSTYDQAIEGHKRIVAKYS